MPNTVRSLAVVLSALLVACAPTPPELQRLEFRGVCGADACAQPLNALVPVVERRLSLRGITASVTAEGPDRIVVTLPLDADPEPVRRLLGRAGVVKFVPIQDAEPPPEHGTRVIGPSLVTGADVASAAIGVDERGLRAINIQLGPEGAATLHEHMGQHVGSYFAVTVDDVALSVPQIVEPIRDGRIQITTPRGMDLTVAEELEMFLESGPLPFPLEPVPAGG